MRCLKYTPCWFPARLLTGVAAEETQWLRDHRRQRGRPSRTPVEKKRSPLGGPHGKPRNCTDLVWTRYEEIFFLYFFPLPSPAIPTIKLSQNGSPWKTVTIGSLSSEEGPYSIQKD